MGSLLDRIALTKRHQAAARAGEAAALPAPDGAEAEREASAPRAGAASSSARLNHQADFEQLLQVIGRHYQYDEDDFNAMRALLADGSEAGSAELARTVNEWRLELVAQGLTAHLDEATAHRCWQAFAGASQPAPALAEPAEDQPRSRSMPTL